MTPKEKAIELLDKMNNMPITIKEWNKASDYAKNNLKRKVLIVVEEILECILATDTSSNKHNEWNKEIINQGQWWRRVQQEIEKL
jgi:hypothetical protein